MESLEELVEVYKTATQDLHFRCMEFEEEIRAAKRTIIIGEASKVAMLEEELATSERARKALEKEVLLFSSYQVTSNDRVRVLKRCPDTFFSLRAETHLSSENTDIEVLYISI